MKNFKEIIEKTKNMFQEEIKIDGNYKEPVSRLWYFDNLKKLLGVIKQLHDSPFIEEQDRKDIAIKLKVVQRKIDEYKVYNKIQT